MNDEKSLTAIIRSFVRQEATLVADYTQSNNIGVVLGLRIRSTTVSNWKLHYPSIIN